MLTFSVLMSSDPKDIVTDLTSVFPHSTLTYGDQSDNAYT